MGYSMIRSMFVAAAVATQLLAFSAAWAQRVLSDTPFTSKEIALLPDYCQDKIAYVAGGEVEKNAAYWMPKIGPMWLHMHHYCYGLAAYNRATLFPSVSANIRTDHLVRSLSEYDYVLKQRPPRDWVLLPELLTKKAESLVRLKRWQDAVPPLQLAIEVKPDYWPPYVVMSDLFKEAGDHARALEWIDKGLAVAPNVKALTSRRAELLARGGGKGAGSHPPQPNREPIKPSVPPDPAAAPPAVGGPEIRSEEK